MAKASKTVRVATTKGETATENMHNPQHVFVAGKDKGEIARTVYIKASDSLKEVIVRAEAMANATLYFVAALTVHSVVRYYHHDDSQRADFATTKGELLAAIQEHAQTKRGQVFKHAWTDRLLAASRKMGTALLTDYAKKGVTGPVADVLRSKTAADATELVFRLMVEKTKGVNSLVALEQHFSDNTAFGKKPTEPQKRTSNNVKASTDKPARIAKALVLKGKGAEIINAIPGKATAKAEKLAEIVGSGNVDHTAFVMNSLKFIASPDDLMKIAERATELAKEIAAKAVAPAEPAKPAKAVAQAQ